MSELKDIDESMIVQQLNHTLRDLLLLWFSVGFLHMERVTWESACDILQKVRAVFCKHTKQTFCVSMLLFDIFKGF